jgi:uncharacterized membrane protein YoaK (UPF0700 family)
MRFLGWGHIFTANMTGNVVFLAFALVGKADFSALRSSMALIGFLLGAAAGGYAAQRLAPSPTNRWVSGAFAVDGAVLIAAAVVSSPLAGPNEANSIALFVVISMTAAAMGFRNATVRRLGVPDLTTTVLTMTITGMAADSSLADGNNPRWPRRICAVLTMFGGAIIGALLLKYSAAIALLLCGVISIGCALAVLKREPEA